MVALDANRLVKVLQSQQLNTGDDMRPGDIALCRPGSWVGDRVSDFDQSRYCHVRLIVDADGGTVEANPPGAYKGHVQPGDVIVTPPLTDDQRAKIQAAADGLVGTPYSFADIAALALKRLGIRLPGLNHRIARSDRLICSQLVDVVWQSVGYKAFTDGRLPQDVTPGDLADMAFTNDWPTTTH